MATKLTSLLIANRGEIAIRVARAAAECGLRTVTVHSEDDAAALHTKKSDETRALLGTGPAAYLDVEQIVAAASAARCDAIHPGYGFLSENAAFARRCAAEGFVFVGPAPEVIEGFGDKARARALAQRLGVPVLAGTTGPTSLEEARKFFAAEGGIMLKAIAGGGGRGMRPVHHADELEAAYARCCSEALQSFGNGDVYAERLLPRARHIEVQVAGDRYGSVSHLWERECSIQRQRQKLIEVAPAPGLGPRLRERLLQAALTLSRAAGLDNLATVEFLVDADGGEDAAMAFIEANPRLQVEHTVTEEITGLDLVRIQLELAAGRTLGELGIEPGQMPEPRGMAMQVRINMETMAPDGSAHPASGILTAFEPPAGPGIRVDTFGYQGYRTSPRFDSLLAKLVVSVKSGALADVAGKAYRALCEFKIAGVSTNAPFLQSLLRHPALLAGRVHTGFVEEHLTELLSADTAHRRLFVEPAASAPRVGARVDPDDPLAVLAHGKRAPATAPADRSSVPEPDDTNAMEIRAPEGTVPIVAPVPGTVVSVSVREGDTVRAGDEVLVMEAMKMEHVIQAHTSGTVRAITVARGDTVLEGHALCFIEEVALEHVAEDTSEEIDLDTVRPDLAEVLGRQAKTRDAARPGAVSRRRKTGQQTARENISRLCDEGAFVEYGSLVIAARRQRNTIQELIGTTPADGLVMGVGRVNGHLFPDALARCVVMSYDYTVLAGTQGKKNHQKKDRLFRLAERERLPIVFFTEGGGGRPGDTDQVFAANLHTPAFHLFGRLSGLVPLVGITSGRCFAGNAVLLGCCDVVIATAHANIGMGGPAMIEGGGLGVFRPEEVGPMSVQTRNGVVDLAVADEVEAARTARQYLSYFQGAVADWSCADQRLLRRAVPENRLRVYDVRSVLTTLADTGSVLELRRDFGVGMITALIRVEGRPVGVVANNPMHLGGAIDSDGADKAARFMQLCDAYDIPLLFLCDTPGNMVGPEAERTALVRHCCRLYVIGANLTVPFFTVVLRKAYGLGAQAMAGGGFHAPFFAVSWPTGEFGGMGLEGAVKLGYRNELAAIEDPVARKRKYEEMVAAMYEKGKALNAATLFEIDDVIDPADTRRWIMAGLRSAPPPPPRIGKKHPWIDAW
ncbi:MAG TPA: carboxyl transferase domain-containing protein [Candidatus Methylomirabilis sp.]|nr:carboxyl transferase domain-containing protein [Candidatus Methylomirabilis sp.]